MKIIFNNKLKQAQYEEIRRAVSGVELVIVDRVLDAPQGALAEAEVLVTWGFNREITPEFLERMPSLKWVHTLSAGVERIPVDVLAEKRITLTNTRGIHGIPISETVYGMMLAFSRGLHILRDQQRERVWKRVPGDELWGKTLGIVGLGSIGREIARRAGVFGMRVIGIKAAPRPLEGVEKVYDPSGLPEVLKQSDYVVLSAPLLESTYHLIGEKQLKMMKPTAVLINIARGDLVDEAAVLKALNSGVIRGYGSDVFEVEPLPEASPLYGHPNVIISPHQSGLSPMYMPRAIELFAENLKRFARGEQLLNEVDPVRGY